MITGNHKKNIIHIKSGKRISVGSSVKIKKKHRVFEKDYIWNPATCNCENCKYVGSFIDNSVIICYEIIETTKSVPAKTVPTKIARTNFFILLAFFIIYHCIIDSCQYLLLPDKIQSKRKTFIAVLLQMKNYRKFYIY